MPVYYVGEPGEGSRRAAEAVRRYWQAQDPSVRWVVRLRPESERAPLVDRRKLSR